MITAVLNWVVNKMSWFMSAVLHIPDMPDFIVEPINFLLNLFESACGWVSWLFPQAVWEGLIDLFVVFVTAKLIYWIYKLVVRLIGIFL